MTESMGLKATIEALRIQRNGALDDAAQQYARAEILQAEVTDLQAELEALRIQKSTPDKRDQDGDPTPSKN